MPTDTNPLPEPVAPADQPPVADRDVTFSASATPAPPTRPVERLFPFVLRARILLIGRETLRRSRNKLHFVLMTRDISEASRAELLADFAPYPIVQHFTADDLERFFGIRGAKVIGFAKSGLAQSIYAELKGRRINKPSSTPPTQATPRPPSPEPGPAKEQTHVTVGGEGTRPWKGGKPDTPRPQTFGAGKPHYGGRTAPGPRSPWRRGATAPSAGAGGPRTRPPYPRPKGVFAGRPGKPGERFADRRSRDTRRKPPGGGAPRSGFRSGNRPRPRPFKSHDAPRRQP